jgi:hypothetical protein
LIGGAIDIFSDGLKAITDLLNGSTESLFDFIKNNPITAIVLGIATVFKIVAVVGTIISTVTAAVGGIVTALGTIFSALSAIGGVFSALAASIGIGLLPLIAIGAAIGVAIYSIVEAFDSASKVFEETGSIFETLKAFFSTFVGNLFGIILDVPKKLISWIAGALGFEKFEAFLDSFSFVDVITDAYADVVDAIAEAFKAAFDSVKKFVSNPIDSVMSFFGDGSDDEIESEVSKGKTKISKEVLNVVSEKTVATTNDLQKSSTSGLASTNMFGDTITPVSSGTNSVTSNDSLVSNRIASNGSLSSNANSISSINGNDPLTNNTFSNASLSSDSNRSVNSSTGASTLGSIINTVDSGLSNILTNDNILGSIANTITSNMASAGDKLDSMEVNKPITQLRNSQVENNQLQDMDKQSGSTAVVSAINNSSSSNSSSNTTIVNNNNKGIDDLIRGMAYSPV